MYYFVCLHIICFNHLSDCSRFESQWYYNHPWPVSKLAMLSEWDVILTLPCQSEQITNRGHLSTHICWREQLALSVFSYFVTQLQQNFEKIWLLVSCDLKETFQPSPSLADNCDVKKEHLIMGGKWLYWNNGLNTI